MAVFPLCNDVIGGDGVRLSELFLGYDMEVYFVDVSPFKDIGEMTSDDFQVRYDNAQFMSKKSLFIDRLRAL